MRVTTKLDIFCQRRFFVDSSLVVDGMVSTRATVWSGHRARRLTDQTRERQRTERQKREELTIEEMIMNFFERI
jgi:hypothetical protein